MNGLNQPVLIFAYMSTILTAFRYLYLILLNVMPTVTFSTSTSSSIPTSSSTSTSSSSTSTSSAATPSSTSTHSTSTSFSTSPSSTATPSSSGFGILFPPPHLSIHCLLQGYLFLLDIPANLTQPPLLRPFSLSCAINLHLHPYLRSLSFLLLISKDPTAQAVLPENRL